MVAVALVAGVIAACGGDEEKAGARISGTVKFQATGAPLPNIDVELGVDKGSGLKPQSTTTDAQGRFSFQGLERGDYTVTALVRGECLALKPGVTVERDDQRIDTELLLPCQ